MPTPVDKLQRVTSIYSDTEDRFRITGEVSADSTRCLWLTQRLLMRLVPPMLEWLNRLHAPKAKAI